ncbi:MAG: Cys-tRNA(Pro) deacylase [Pyrinomonadaceae bacterium]|nr:Cys-tRNA(Pro) deacylase [Pyrinomonadaceae bacterium]
MNHPITQAIRFLRQKKIEFVPYLFDYVEKGGTSYSSQVLGVNEHEIIKTLVFETNEKIALIVLQHGDRQVSTKNLARHIKAKSVSPAPWGRASRVTGYIFGGTSPFGLKTRMPIYAEKSIFDLPKIYINGGKRGFLVEIDPKVLKEVLAIEEVEVSQ